MVPHQEWQPHDLLHCLDSVWLGWATAALAGGVVWWYVLITIRWWQSARSASGTSRIVWRALVAVFVLCSLGGYASISIAVFDPKTAAIMRVVSMALQNIACPVFLFFASHKQFRAISSRDQIGHEIIKGVGENMGDKELASLARALVIKSLERRTNG